MSPYFKEIPSSDLTQYNPIQSDQTKPNQTQRNATAK